MPLPVQHFGIIPGGQSNPLSGLLKGLTSGYQQGLDNQQTRQKMRHDEMLQKALKDKLSQQQGLQQQVSQLVGSQMPKEQLVPQLASLLAQSGDVKGAIGMIQPKEAKLTSAMQNFKASGGDLSTAEGQKDFMKFISRPTTQVNINERKTPEMIVQQRYFASNAREIYDEISKTMPNISQFAGLGGEFSNKFNEYLSSVGMKPSDAWRDYNKFINTQLDYFSKELNRSMGGSNAVLAHEIIEKLSNPVNSNEDMQQAIENWEALNALMKKNESVLYKTPGEIEKDYKERVSKSDVPRESNNAQPTLSDIDAELRRRGVSQ